MITTSNQEIQKSNQPRNPRPVFLLRWRDPAEIIALRYLSSEDIETGRSVSDFYSPERSRPGHESRNSVEKAIRY